MTSKSLHVAELPPRRSARFRLHGLAASAAVHAAMMSGLLMASLQPWDYENWAAREGRLLYVTLAEQRTDELRVIETRVVTDPADVTGQMLQEKIEQLADESRGRSDAENLQQLDGLAKRLDEVSSEESIDRMAGVFQSLLGTGPRADRPADEPVAGEFDFDTAQFHDVRRVEGDQGGWRYVCILVDAQGRALEVEIDAGEGERVYQTMLRIKQNPLLERVYRRIAMPLFDRMLAGARQAARAGSGSGLRPGLEDEQTGTRRGAPDGGLPAQELGNEATAR